MELTNTGSIDDGDQKPRSMILLLNRQTTRLKKQQRSRENHIDSDLPVTSIPADWKFVQYQLPHYFLLLSVAS